MTTTRDGGMKFTMTAKLIELGLEDGQPGAMFQRIVDPATGLAQDHSGPTFSLPLTEDECRELAPLLYREIEIGIGVVPKR